MRFSRGALVLGPGHRGVLGGAVRAHQRDAELVRPLGHRVGDGRAAQADVAHELDVLGPEARTVQQAREEVGRAAAAGDLLLDHGVEDGRRVPPVDQEQRLAADQRAQQAAQHPDGVPDGGADQVGTVPPGLVPRQLAHLAADRAVRVHDALGVGRRPRGVGDEGRAVGVDGDRALDRLGAAQLVEGDQPEVSSRRGVAHHDLVLQVRQAVADGRQVGQVVAPAVARHDDQGAGPALAQDEAQLLGAVEVHDRDERHPEHGAGVERDRRLHPVGQLEGDDVTGTEAEGPEATGHPQRLLVDVTDRAEIGMRGRPDAEPPARVLEQRVAQELPERAVVPRPFGAVALGQGGRDGAVSSII